jgi:hypothetical protein
VDLAPPFLILDTRVFLGRLTLKALDLFAQNCIDASLDPLLPNVGKWGDCGHMGKCDEAGCVMDDLD